MPHVPLPLTLQLADGESLRWSQRRPARVQVVSGRLWLTRAGDAADHFLHAGDTWWLQREEGVLLGADGPVCLRLESPRPLRRSPWAAMRRLLRPSHRRRGGRADPDGIIFG